MKPVSEPQKLSKEVKELILKSGASLAGIVSAATVEELPRIWIGWTIREYAKKPSEVMKNAKSVIVIGYHVWDDMLEMAIRKDQNWVYPGYFPLDYLMQKTINYIEKKGYEAHAFYRGSCKRMAQLAGLGSFGKNALIINPVYGPWIRWTSVVTSAEIAPDTPFEEDLCGDCDDCIKACPAGALTPYKVDDAKCLVGRHITDKEDFEQDQRLVRFEPVLTKNSHLMCIQCQKACKYGRDKR